MDQQKLRSLVFEKTGVKIDVDDPIFALVALNEAVLEEAVERHVAHIDAATRELLATAGAPRAAAAAAPSTTATPSAPPLPRGARAGRIATRHGLGLEPHEWRGIALAAGAAVLGAVLVLLGHALFFKPAPVPAPIVQAKELTPAQTAALERAAKLDRIIDKLDAKTRTTIKNELQKP